MTLEAYCDLFDPPGAYLDHAATGVLGRHVLEAVSDYLRGRAGQVPERSPNDFPADLDRIERARRRAAALVNADLASTCLVPNTSAGLNLLVEGLDWRAGDRVAVPGCEFPANLLPWLGLEARGVRVDRIADREGVVGLEAVETALRPETRVVALSAVQFLSGARADLEAVGALCRERGVLFAVDAIQAVGAVGLDVEAAHVDLLACGGHKWIGGMQGAGFAVVGPRLLERLEPVRGWLNGPVDWDDFASVRPELHPDATRFHTGTLPTAGLYALDAALGAALAVGIERIEAAVLESASRLAEGLERLGHRRVGPEAVESGIVTVEAPDPEGLHEHLARRGVAVSLRSRLVRFAAHAHTRPEAVDAALDAVAQFGASRPAAA